jgi:hypothetical protein
MRQYSEKFVTDLIVFKNNQISDSDLTNKIYEVTQSFKDFPTGTDETVVYNQTIPPRLVF